MSPVRNNPDTTRFTIAGSIGHTRPSPTGATGVVGVGVAAAASSCACARDTHGAGVARQLTRRPRRCLACLALRV